MVFHIVEQKNQCHLYVQGVNKFTRILGYDNMALVI